MLLLPVDIYTTDMTVSVSQSKSQQENKKMYFQNISSYFTKVLSVTPVAVHRRKTLQQHWDTAAVMLSWNRTLTCWTLYQGSNSFGCHPLSYHSSEQRQTVCHRLWLHYSQWPSQRNGSIWESGWLTPGALAAEMLQHKISTEVKKKNTTLQLHKMSQMLRYSKRMMMHRNEPTHIHIRMHTVIKKACVNKTPAVLTWYSNLHIFERMPANVAKAPQRWCVESLHAFQLMNLSYKNVLNSK